MESATLVLPKDAPKWASERENLWNEAEGAETRKNSTVAREFEIALPSELNPEQRKQLALQFARELVDTHGFAADVAIHEPGREGDIRNHHAHILVTTRVLESDGFKHKTRELDERTSGVVDHWRSRFAFLQNHFLREAGLEMRVDHRSNLERGINELPSSHLGPSATAIERRGQRSKKGLKHDQDKRDFAALCEQEDALQHAKIAEIEGELGFAMAERHALQEQEVEQKWRVEQQRQEAETERFLQHEAADASPPQLEALRKPAEPPQAAGQVDVLAAFKRSLQRPEEPPQQVDVIAQFKRSRGIADEPKPAQEQSRKLDQAQPQKPNPKPKQQSRDDDYSPGF